MAALRKPLSLKALRNKVLSTVFGLVWSPSLLFANNEVGAWYDPSDLSTMYQDSAGTTPVTAVEQPVGLLLDKSKGLALGAELVANGNFNTGTGTTGWTPSGCTQQIVGSELETTCTVAGFIETTATITTVVGSTYTYTANVWRNQASGTARVTVGGLISGASVTSLTATSVRIIFKAVVTTTTIKLDAFGASIGDKFSYSTVSVRELPGNHASQSTAASRPVLSARVNLLTRTEEFDSAAWAALSGGTGSAPTRTANYAASPIGTQTATRVQFSKGAGTTGSDYCLLYQSTTSTSAATRTIWIKSNSGSTQNLILYDNQNASAGTLQIAATTSWQKFTLSNSVAEGACLFVLGLRGGAGYGGDNSVDVLLWGADLRVTNVGVNLPAYQRVAAATDYDTSGFPLYLQFDGVDDSLATGTIDFTATDKMSVFAGVRKLSDAAGGNIVSLGNVTSVNGSFELRAPRAAAPNYMFASRGTSFADANIASGYSAPITNVVTGIADIASDLCALRINGTVVASPTTDQGTGNYSSGVVFIGRFGGTALPFNGRLYSLIVRGAQSTDAQIASTEAWVDGKTGAY